MPKRKKMDTCTSESKKGQITPLLTSKKKDYTTDLKSVNSTVRRKKDRYYHFPKVNGTILSKGKSTKNSPSKRQITLLKKKKKGQTTLLSKVKFSFKGKKTGCSTSKMKKDRTLNCPKEK